LERADVLIIGGGVIGCSTAFFLSQKNVDIVLIEKSDVGREASGATAGTLSIQNKELDLIPLAREGVKIWSSFKEILPLDIEFHQMGGLRVAEDDRQLELLRRSIEEQKRAGLELELMIHRDLVAFAPYLSPAISAASFCREDAKCNPLLATPALSRAAQALGARIYTHEAVTRIKIINKDSFIVETTKEQYAVSCIANCAGVWSKHIFRMIGLDIPIRLSPQQMMVTEPVSKIVDHVITHIKGKITLKQVDSGNILIGGGWEGYGDLDENKKYLCYESLLGNAQIACRIVPAMKGLNLIRCWIGSEGRTPDLLPILGNLTHFPQFYTACCAKGGFTIGPFMAKVVAELIVEGKTDYPVSKFNAGRFIS
jgi:glycine/D-amino acid oxidase-like deaminating enzyme